jgi:hypothetical protein
MRNNVFPLALFSLSVSDQERTNDAISATLQPIDKFTWVHSLQFRLNAALLKHSVIESKCLLQDPALNQMIRDLKRPAQKRESVQAQQVL